MKVQAENKEPAPGNAAGKEGEAGEGARRLLKVVGETSVVEDENVVVDDDGQLVEKGSVGKVGEKEEVLVGVHPATNPTTKPLEKISCTSRQVSSFLFFLSLLFLSVPCLLNILRPSPFVGKQNSGDS